MTPERVVALVTAWVRLYTRNLPGEVAERRRDELAADLHDHVAHERAQGTSDRRIALAIAARMLSGLVADLAWRRRVLAGPSLARALVRVALVTGAILLVPLVAMQLTGEVDWTLADFVFAAVLLVVSGFALELALAHPRTLAYRAVTTAIGLFAILFGNADDAPGLVLVGCLLILGTIGLAVRTAWRSE